MGLSPARRISGLARIGALGVALAALVGCATLPEGGQAQRQPADIPIAASGGVHPESITADDDGNIYVGSVLGTIFRAAPGASEATPWVSVNQDAGPQALLGVLADERHGLLWTCVNPNMFMDPPGTGKSTLQAFALDSGNLSASYDFPLGKPTVCNDIAVAADGTVFASETASGRIFTLSSGANELELFAEGEELVGIDGLAFAEDGTLYINNVRTHEFQRVNRDADGAYAGLTTLALDDTLNGPDGLRPLGGNRFIQAEGPGGRVAIIEVSGDSAKVVPVKEGLNSSPGAMAIGDVGYAVEGKIGYLIDPKLRGQDPGPFVIRAFALPK